ncbi:hypothetical protein EXIGLDRAFT_838079 [Exidia glandulosa HHB12029]|uniref:Uncharacterized protein n=1 Tax=Exidia glandulosa HHB12029 TaxID=1314781 RepID=A0A165G6H3_EXIGL|nr:hypothetical protein EXIGLDRAFT_838079 [Exidia glandulosa HHB12029]
MLFNLWTLFLLTLVAAAVLEQRGSAGLLIADIKNLTMQTIILEAKVLKINTHNAARKGARVAPALEDLAAANIKAGDDCLRAPTDPFPDPVALEVIKQLRRYQHVNQKLMKTLIAKREILDAFSLAIFSGLAGVQNNWNSFESEDCIDAGLIPTRTDEALEIHAAFDLDIAEALNVYIPP